MELDEIDREILGILEKRGRINYTELGKELDVSDVAAKKRVAKLKENGVIERFTVDLDYEEIGRPLHAYIFVKTSPKTIEKLERKLPENDKVLRYNRTIGEYDLVIEAACRDLDELKGFTEREIGNLRAVQEIRTAIITG